MTDENKQHNSQCTDKKHKDHLCFLMCEGWDLENPADYNALTTEPEFKCRYCDRTAKSEENLCGPLKL